MAARGKNQADARSCPGYDQGRPSRAGRQQNNGTIRSIEGPGPVALWEVAG